jgi:hypothetical protein
MDWDHFRLLLICYNFEFLVYIFKFFYKLNLYAQVCLSLHWQRNACHHADYNFPHAALVCRIPMHQTGISFLHANSNFEGVLNLSVILFSGRVLKSNLSKIFKITLLSYPLEKN